MATQGKIWSRAGAAGAVPLALLTMMMYAAGPASAVAAPPAVVAPAAPRPTPSCQEWQTITLLPQPASPSASPTSWQPWCHNAPPTPFEQPAVDPETVVGGALLGQSGVIVDAEPGVPALPEVGDVSYVLADLDSGEILAAKSPHAWLRPASTLKTLTALTLIPRLDPKQVVVATKDQVDANGTRAGMLVGNPYPVKALFEALLMLSANDAAYGLADAAGGYDKTLALMNAKAKEIGAYDTIAVDPSGLDEPGQHSSAYDLALIGRAAMQLKDFRAYITQRDAIFPGGVDKQTKQKFEPFHIPNINTLLGNYPGAIGIKPGRTNRAQHTFIGAATRHGRTLIVSQMGSTSGSWKPTAALLDWGFANADSVKAVGRLVDPGEATHPIPLVDARVPAAQSPASGTPHPAASVIDSAPDIVEQSRPILSGGTIRGAAVLISAVLVGGGLYLARRLKH